jgi:hypothetical protein
MAENQIELLFGCCSMEIENLINFLEQRFRTASPSEKNKVFIFSNLFRLKFNRVTHRRLISSLIDHFPGTSFFFPAYTYNSRLGYEFLPNQPPNTQCGSLSRVVHEDFGHLAYRTMDEDYSYLVLNHSRLSGQMVEKISNWRESSFGGKSHHEALFDESGTFVVIADEMQSGFTPSMHCEAIAQVPYRTMIRFPSMIVPNREKFYFARDEENFRQFGKSNRHRSIDLMRSHEKLGSFKHESGVRTLVFPVQDYIELVSMELKRNPFYFLESAP